MEGKDVFSSIIGHLGDGNFHEAIFYNKSHAEETAMVSKVVHDMVDRVLEMEGTCTVEHSVGLSKKDALLQELGSHTVNAIIAIKLSLDPKWLMNPRKIFDSPYTQSVYQWLKSKCFIGRNEARRLESIEETRLRGRLGQDLIHRRWQVGWGGQAGFTLPKVPERFVWEGADDRSQVLEKYNVSGNRGC